MEPPAAISRISALCFCCWFVMVMAAVLHALLTHVMLILPKQCGSTMGGGRCVPGSSCGAVDEDRVFLHPALNRAVIALRHSAVRILVCFQVEKGAVSSCPVWPKVTLFAPSRLVLSGTPCFRSFMVLGVPHEIRHRVPLQCRTQCGISCPLVGIIVLLPQPRVHIVAVSCVCRQISCMFCQRIHCGPLGSMLAC